VPGVVYDVRASRRLRRLLGVAALAIAVVHIFGTSWSGLVSLVYGRLAAPASSSRLHSPASQPMAHSAHHSAAIVSRMRQRCTRVQRLADGDCGEGSDTDSRGDEGDDAVEADDDSTNVELFRQSLIQGWGGGVVGSASSDSVDWAEVVQGEKPELRPGDLLLANPADFIGEGTAVGTERVGLSGRIPPDWPLRERLRMLPVVLLTKVGSGSDVAEGLWLSVRTGRLMGDFINHFHSRPLHLGGPVEAGLTMIHPYPQVPDAKPLGSGGLFLGGDFSGAQAWVDDGEGSSLRFRFFLNRVQWGPGELAAEANGGAASRTWIPIRCSAGVALAEVDSSEDKPLWLRVAQLAGGSVEAIAEKFGLL